MAVISRAGTLLAIVAALSAPTFAQRHEPSEAAGGPFTVTAILDAPFSAEAITKVREALSNGTVLEQTVTARYYRDSRGRVRAELDTPWGPYVILAIPGAIPTGARASAELMPPDCRESARRPTRTASAIRSPQPGRPDPRTSRRTTARRAICPRRLPAARRVPILSPRA